MDTYYIGLGANMGDSADSIAKAVGDLNQLPEITVKAVSSMYETPPWGNTDQAQFFNAVVVIETDLPPEALLNECMNIEAMHGRIRHEKWGPRPLDIDLIYSPTQFVQTPRLQLPHPLFTQRAFVLIPLKEVAPDLMVMGKSIDTYLQNLQEDTSEIKVIGKITIPGVN